MAFDSKGFKLESNIERKVEKIISNPKNYLNITNKAHKTGKALRLEDASGRYSEYLKSTLNKKNKLKN